MLGCDYHCAYCQNWLTSQAVRDPLAGTLPNDVSAERIVGIAIERNVPILTSTYNEPLITSEWAVEIFKLAKSYDIKCSFVSNGNATPEVIEYLQPYLHMYKVDLKSFQQKNYQQLGGRLQTVLETIQMLHRARIWVEVVTLVVPGFNDSEDELTDIAKFIASVSPDIPWHVTAFHQDYHMTEPDNTEAKKLVRAAEIGFASGLHFVYAGNLPGMTGRFENTLCPSCGAVLIKRRGYTILANNLQNGSCSSCHTAIPGIWT
jgi:pyruvate formate lyase activating enzyme